MRKLIAVAIILLVAGCGQQKKETPTGSSTKNVMLLLSAEKAKTVLERIDPELKFTLQSNEYMGSTDRLYYADVKRPASQVTINIGKREDAREPLTNLYINVSALRPLDESVQNEIKKLVDRYISGFLVEAFPRGKELSVQCALPIGSSSVGKTYETETETCAIECSTSKGDGNPQYLEYLLRITEKSFQEELDRRLIGATMP